MYIIPPLCPAPRRLLPKQQYPLPCRPPQQPKRGTDKPQHNNLVLGAIPLEAGRDDVLLLGVLADGQVLRDAERAVALAAGGSGGGARFQERGGAGEQVRSGCGFGLGRQLDDGAVGEACAFAERGRGWRVSVSGERRIMPRGGR